MLRLSQEEEERIMDFIENPPSTNWMSDIAVAHRFGVGRQLIRRLRSKLWQRKQNNESLA